MSLATFVLAAALNPGGLIAWLVIGLVAGWLAGVIMPGKGFGLLGDLVIGLVGAFIGGLIINLLVPDATFGFCRNLLNGLIVAFTLFVIVHAITGRRTTTARPKGGSAQHRDEHESQRQSFSTSTGVYSVQAGGLRQLRQERPWRAGQRLARFVFPFRGG